jgi:hypothetical protein
LQGQTKKSSKQIHHSLMRRKGWPLQHGKKLMTKQKPSLKGLGIEDLEEIPSFNAGHFLWREHRSNQDLANNTVQ